MSKAASTKRLYIGCAGWNVPRSAAAMFPVNGSHLERYADRLSAVEINTSFYRSHRPATYSRWAASVPEEFRFSVKVPKHITHELRLREASEPTEQFLREVGALGKRLGCLLVQLPPSLQFAANAANSFFAHLRDSYPGNVACEPRHQTWFSPDAEELLQRHKVARVAADPSLHRGAGEPCGYSDLQYFRLHGSPKTYYSRYSDEFLTALATKVVGTDTQEVWCIFDNTAIGHAIENAIQLQTLTSA